MVLKEYGKLAFANRIRFTECDEYVNGTSSLIGYLNMFIVSPAADE
jgi:hypothetical protein